MGLSHQQNIVLRVGKYICVVKMSVKVKGVKSV